MHATGVPHKRLYFPAHRHVPDPDRAIHTGRGQAGEAGIRTKHYCRDRPAVAFERVQFPPGCCVPDFDKKTSANPAASCREVVTIRAERHGLACVGDRKQFFPGGRIPNL